MPVAKATDAAGIAPSRPPTDFSEARVGASYGLKTSVGLDLLSGKGFAHAHSCRLRQQMLPTMQLFTHELVAIDTPFGPEA